MQSLPLEAKISMSNRRIVEWYERWDGKVYVSRSGGKDSDVLGDLVKRLYPDVPQVFVNTGLEHDSVRIHGTEVSDVVLRPGMNFFKVITKYGYPVISKEVAQTVAEVQKALLKGEEPPAYRMSKLNGTCINKRTGELSTYNIPQWKFLLDAPFRISHECCNVMKKKPAKLYEKQTSNKPYIGTMASESRLRKSKWTQHGCNAFTTKRPTSNPLSFWTERDILQYILKYGIEIADAYGDIAYTDKDGMYYFDALFADSMNLTTTKAKRTGCVFCMFGITQDPERYLKLKEDEPKKYDYVMRGGNFDEHGLWIPTEHIVDNCGNVIQEGGLGYKFVIDWLNEHGNLGIQY